jgi:hypothetical protein
VKRTSAGIGIMALVLTGCETTTSTPVTKPAPLVTTTVTTPSPTVTQTPKPLPAKPKPAVPTYVHPGQGLISEADFYKWVKLNTTHTPAQGKKIAYEACMLMDDHAEPAAVLSVLIAEYGGGDKQVAEEAVAVTADIKAYCPEHNAAWVNWK